MCEQLLTPEEVASLTEDGLTLAAEATAFDFDYPIVQEIAADGVLCRWTGQGDVSVVVGQLAVDDDEWTERQTTLLAEGFVADDASAAGFPQRPRRHRRQLPGPRRRARRRRPLLRELSRHPLVDRAARRLSAGPRPRITG
ncbi:hypothetical protein Q0F99_12085 [Rathayibacter oskolensis]|uniref:hypothetical protein n=1 Tax=Rathayibacter oskolensis TaxID=1891671 RepID=UPI0026605225|nr:hypothetical protein [Rathayibacter oskolensis]WKK70591.1 hypothetical protein Q0F99_12085 [Rathayibacter oskolensis]